MEKLGADPKYKDKRFVQVALGVVSKDQDPRDSLGAFTINKATVALFDIKHKLLLDYDSFPELTKDQIREEDELEEVVDEALHYEERQKIKREQDEIAIYGTSDLDFESRSPK